MTALAETVMSLREAALAKKKATRARTGAAPTSEPFSTAMCEWLQMQGHQTAPPPWDYYPIWDYQTSELPTAAPSLRLCIVLDARLLAMPMTG
ncbi:uncharacterized protein AMSG_02781 [Thecamonas trahens ATCC 50062]|uniref:Uncharacterized protein n=1 Tax=Thecamonas trahens ATCC 50062 TaxID=461836 RepID=A0A0L0D1U3_THETB|nr:hypothetical protein AMSG_02781 [Thecamonas trahens ATCC 50062]KNC46329.1 hypothetical protein AMSG_02781 [Thecamonas trahens ATCC 50062]|eukprot:XP_013760622.1 hypothetical protein AMSG_02781 [Thecamonas trahens ATCC 50062]